MNTKLFLYLCHSLWQLANSASIPSLFKKWSLFRHLFESGLAFWLALSNKSESDVVQFLRKPCSFHKTAPSKTPAAMLGGSPRWHTQSERTRHSQDVSVSASLPQLKPHAMEVSYPTNVWATYRTVCKWRVVVVLSRYVLSDLLCSNR